MRDFLSGRQTREAYVKGSLNECRWKGLSGGGGFTAYDQAQTIIVNRASADEWLRFGLPLQKDAHTIAARMLGVIKCAVRATTRVSRLEA